MSEEPGRLPEGDNARREDLLRRAREGDLSPIEAEAEAERLGFGPLTAHPDPSLFDPAIKSHWSTAMVFGWIVSRDLAEVRKFDNVVRSQSTEWRAEPIFKTDGDGHWKLEKFGWVIEAQWPTSGLAFPGQRSTILGVSSSRDMHEAKAARARAQLWGAAGDGRLVADGVNRDEERVAVPAREWPDLRESGLNGEVECFQSRLTNGPTYRDVLWKREGVLSIWPKYPVGAAGLRRTRIVGTEAHRREFQEWIDQIIAAAGRPPTVALCTTWASERRLTRVWVRRERAALAPEKRLRRGVHT